MLNWHRKRKQKQLKSTSKKLQNPGYRFVETKKLPNGDTVHIYEKVVTPEKPEAPVKPAPAKENAPQLPNTGTEYHASLSSLVLVVFLSGFVLIARKKKED